MKAMTTAIGVLLLAGVVAAGCGAGAPTKTVTVTSGAKASASAAVSQSHQTGDACVDCSRGRSSRGFADTVRRGAWGARAAR